MASFIITSQVNSVLVEIDGKKASFGSGDIHPYTADGSLDTVYIYDQTGILKKLGTPSTSERYNASKDRIPIVIGSDTISVNGTTSFTDADELLTALEQVFFLGSSMPLVPSNQVVNTYAELPDPTTASDQVWFVTQQTGSWILGTRRQSGFYVSDGSTWTHTNDPLQYFVDDQLAFKDNIDQTKTLQFQLDQISSATNRVATWPDKSGTVAFTDDVGGQVDSIQEGTRIDVDATDPVNPIVSVDTATDAQINDNTTNISANASDIAQEVIDRTNADNTLQTNIDNEELARIAGDEGTVTIHSDVSNAGSGQIITTQERADINASINVHSDVDLTGVINQDNYVLRWDSSQLAFIPCLHQIYRSSALVINNTNVLQDKINVSVNIQRLNIHRITISYGWSLNDGGQDLVSVASLGGQRIQNALTIDEIHRQEPKDVAGADPDGRGTNQKHGFYQRYYVVPPSLGPNALILQFSGGANGDLASMWEASIEIEELISVTGT